MIRYILAAVLCALPVLGSAQGEKEKGFVSLFDGKTLDGWQGAVKGYVVQDGALVCKGGNLFSKKEYADFILRFEFKLPPGGNNGIAIRSPLKGHIATQGIEIQVLDNSAARYAKLKPYQYHGSVYGVVPAKRGYLKKAGEWNQQEIKYQGSHITVTLNGTVIVDADLAKFVKNGTPDKRKHPGLERAKGHIGFLGHGSPVAFRKIRIKEL